MVLFGDGEGEALTSSEDEKKEKQDSSAEEEEEKAPEDRCLDDVETEMFLVDLYGEIGKLPISAGLTIGEQLRSIKTWYMQLIPKFDTNNSSNPIVAFCNALTGIDNFSTTSLTEKELYEQYIIYQFTRAVTILTVMDSPTLYQEELEGLEERMDVNSTKAWFDVEKGTRDKNGNPYCYLMEGYVRLGTAAEVKAFWNPCTLNKTRPEYKPRVEVKSRRGTACLL